MRGFVHRILSRHPPQTNRMVTMVSDVIMSSHRSSVNIWRWLDASRDCAKGRSFNVPASCFMARLNHTVFLNAAHRENSGSQLHGRDGLHDDEPADSYGIDTWAIAGACLLDWACSAVCCRCGVPHRLTKRSMTHRLCTGMLTSESRNPTSCLGSSNICA